MSKNKQSLCAIGLMSGTSMDGVDAGILEAEISDGVARLLSLGAHLEMPFDGALRRNLTAVLGAEQPSAATHAIEVRLGEYYTEAVQALLQKAGLSADDVDVVGLHGQTITHRPEKGLTWQLGDGAWLARENGIAVVYDFRQNDIAHGGQGAPLAPVFHQALAQSGFLPSLPLVVLNIGGVSNITVLSQTSIRAYDTGPGNGPMDDYVREFLNLDCDQDGEIARSGQVHEDIVAAFLSRPYFSQTAPKSLDRRDFDHRPVAHLTPPDALRTLCACSAAAIASGARQERATIPELSRMVLAGGGRHNPVLCQEIQAALPEFTLMALDDLPHALNGDALEAWAFAWLAVLNRAQIPASFPTTTGVRTPQIAGRFVSP